MSRKYNGIIGQLKEDLLKTCQEGFKGLCRFG